MHTIHNARIQLLANLLNMAANGCFAVGIAAPIVGVLFHQLPRPGPVIAGGLIWLVILCVLHTSAQYLLGGLHDD